MSITTMLLLMLQKHRLIRIVSYHVRIIAKINLIRVAVWRVSIWLSALPSDTLACIRCYYLHLLLHIHLLELFLLFRG